MVDVRGMRLPHAVTKPYANQGPVSHIYAHVSRISRTVHTLVYGMCHRKPDGGDLPPDDVSIAPRSRAVKVCGLRP